MAEPGVSNDFFGREDELRAIEEHLSLRNLVTLVGAGGVGKTRLAGQVSAIVARRYRDGVARVDLATVASADLVVRSIAEASGTFDASADREGDESILRTVLDVLADRSLLVVLDNCEHVVDETARVCDRILDACPEVRILATSRQALGVTNEQRIVIGPLDGPAAVALFRARAAAVGAELGTTDLAAVERICELVDRLALAVELAAARTRMMSLSELEERLEHSLGLLSATNRSTSPRQATMLATLRWSTDALAPGEKALFIRLGVFRGGWRLPAVEAVCAGTDEDGDDVLERLASLVDKSLVVFDQRSGRYRLLEPVRQHAWDLLLTSGEAPALVSAHRRHYRAMAEEINGRVLRSGVTDADRADMANFRAAIDRAIEAGNGRGGLAVFVSLGWYWVVTGAWREAVDVAVRALALANSEGTPTLELTGRAMVAGFLAYSGRPQEAHEYVEQTLRLLDRVPDDYAARYLVSTALECVGLSPIEVLITAEANATAAGDDAFAAYIAGALSRYHLLMWRAEDALVPLARARATADRVGAVFAEEMEVKALGLDAALGRDLDADLLRRLETGRVNRSGMAFSGDDRSLALCLAGDPARAAAAIGVETRIAARGGWAQRVLLQLAMAAVARARLGQADQALVLAQAAQTLGDTLGYAPLPIVARAGSDHLAAAASSLGPSATRRARQRGAGLDLPQAVELACSAVPAPYAGPLSSREAELMGLLGEGHDNAQIASILGISRRTIDAHLSHIRTKLGVTSRAGLIRWAIDHDLVHPSHPGV